MRIPGLLAELFYALWAPAESEPIANLDRDVLLHKYGLIDMTDPRSPTFVPPGSSLFGPGAQRPLMGANLIPGRLGSDTGTLLRGPQPLLGSDLQEVPETWESQHPSEAENP